MAKGGTEKAVAKAPVDHPVDALAGPAHLLGPGLLHLPVVRRADGRRSWAGRAARMFGALSAGLMVAGLCSIPVGAWIDRGHGRMLMTGGSLLAAALLVVWSRIESLPLFYAMWIGLGACQAVLLYEPAFAVITRVYGPRYKQAILLMTFLGGLASTFGIPFTQFLIERVGWRREPRGAGGDQRGRRLFMHWLFVPGPQEKPVPIGEAKPRGRRQAEEEPARGGDARAGVLGPGRGLRGLRPRLLGDELPSDPAARRSRRADRRGDGHHRPDRAHAGGGPRAADGRASATSPPSSSAPASTSPSRSPWRCWRWASATSTA